MALALPFLGSTGLPHSVNVMYGPRVRTFPKTQEPLQNYVRQMDEMKSLTENPQMLGAILQNLVTWTTWRLSLCNPDILQQ